MKKIALVLIAATLVFSCSKKDSNKNVTPVVNDLATMSVVANPDSSLTVNIHYTSKNVGSYLDDVLKLYVAGVFVNNITVSPKPANTDYNTTFSLPKYAGGGYKVVLIRDMTSTQKDTVSTVSGI